SLLGLSRLCLGRHGLGLGRHRGRGDDRGLGGRGLLGRLRGLGGGLLRGSLLGHCLSPKLCYSRAQPERAYFLSTANEFLSVPAAVGFLWQGWGLGGAALRREESPAPPGRSRAFGRRSRRSVR